MRVDPIFSYHYKAHFLRESLRVVPDNNPFAPSYRADLIVRNNQEEWTLCNWQGRRIKNDGKIGKQIIAAVREYKEGLK